MADSLLVGGVERLGNLAPGLRITTGLGETAQATFVLREVGGTFAVEEGDAVAITKGSTTLFSGTVWRKRKRFGVDTALGITFTEFEVSAIDHGELATRPLILAREYAAGQTIGDIVRDMISQDLAGFGVTEGNVEDGPETLNALKIGRKHVSQVLDDLAAFAGFFWRINFDKTLDFCAGATAARGPIDPINESTASLRFAQREESRDGYRNRQFLRGGFSAGAKKTIALVPDGSTRSFLAEDRVFELVEVSVNGVQKTVGVQTDEAASAQWLYTPGSDRITQSSSEAVVPAGAQIFATYRPQRRIQVRVDESAEVTSRGIWDALEEDASLDDEALAIEKAEILIDRWAHQQELISVEIDGSIDWLSGQAAEVDIPSIEASGDYLVVRTSLSAIDTFDHFRAAIEFGALESRVGGVTEFIQRIVGERGVEFDATAQEADLLVQGPADPVAITDAASVDLTNTLEDWQDDPYSVALVGSTAFVGRTPFGEPNPTTP